MRPRVIYDAGRTSVSHCRLCKAEIVWALTDRGRRMPVDVKGSPAGEPPLGNLILHHEDGQYHVTHVSNVSPGELAGIANRWISHWATCPEAAKVRARVRKAEPQPEQLELVPRGRS